MAENACRSFWNYQGDKRADERSQSRTRIAALTQKLKSLTKDRTKLQEEIHSIETELTASGESLEAA